MKLGYLFLLVAALITGAAFTMTSVTESKTVATDVQALASQATPPKFALLVGVNVYSADSGITDLSGTHNDVALMKGLLTEYGFTEDVRRPAATASAPCGDQTPTSSIKTLCSQQATRQAILDAFDKHLIGNAEKYWNENKNTPDKGPTIVFYHSGHGSYVRDDAPLEGEKETDLIKDESDGLDETLVPHDTDKLGSRDIRDDAFDERITKLKKFTSNIVFMADSCHSGTITRGGGKKGVQRQFGVISSAKGDAKPGDNIGSDASYVTVSGSLPTEYSYEDPLPDPVSKQYQLNGYLTYHFVHQLRQNPGATYREIIKLVRTAVTAAGKAQTPQVEGDVDRPVFGSPAARGKRAIAIKCTDKGCSEKITKKNQDGTEFIVQKIKMDVGTIVGARTGGPIDVYAREATELVGDKNKIASGTIVFADPFSSTAEVVMIDPKVPDLPPLAKVVLVAPVFSDEKRIVAIDVSDGTATSKSDVGVENMRKLSLNLKESGMLTPVERSQMLKLLNSMASSSAAERTQIGDWNVAVVRSTFADYKLTRQRSVTKDKAAPDNQQGYFISDRSGNPLYNFWVPADSPNAGDLIKDALEKHVRIENMRALSNESSPMTNGLKVELVRLKDIALTGPNRCQVTEYTASELKTVPRTISLKDKFTLRVTNASSTPFILYALSIDSAGEVTRIFPPVAGARETLAPGFTYSNNGTCAMLFAFDETAPIGREMIKVIASEKELPIDLLTQSAIKGASRSGPLSPIELLFNQAMTQQRTKPFSSDGADWATATVEYEVVP